MFAQYFVNSKYYLQTRKTQMNYKKNVMYFAEIAANIVLQLKTRSILEFV